MQARFLWRVPDLSSVKGVLEGVPGGPVGPLGALELAAPLRAESVRVLVLRAVRQPLRANIL